MIRHALIVFLMFCITASSNFNQEDSFNQIVNEEWQRWVNEDPLFASYLGDKSANQDWPDITEKALRKSQKKEKEVLQKLKNIDPMFLSEKAQLNYRLFLYNYEKYVKSHRFDSHLLVFGQRGGIQLEHETAESLDFSSAQDYEDWLARLMKLPNLIDDHIELANLGIERGVTAPRILMERVSRQIKLQIHEDPIDSPFYNIFSDMSDKINNKDEIQDKARHLIKEKIIPAYIDLDQYFTAVYLPSSRETFGLYDLPNGYEWYEHLANSHTTTELTPNEIHEIGLNEVTRIKQEMMKIIESLDWQGSFDDFLHFLRTDPQFYYETKEELFQAYLATTKKIDPLTVKLFETLPRAPYGIKAIPKESAPDTTTAYYMSPSPDGSRAGYFYVNLYRPEVRPKYEIEVLSVHEAVPGHHLQIALAMELEGIPNFRKYSGYTAFVEGWGLYSESLGEDMGLYRDPYSKFGALTYDMWRAVRLVVDTGMHYKGWSRQKAIDFFKDNAAKTEQDIINEIDRYLIMPGQALAYKIGQLKLLELKKKAQKELGESFNIKEFHNVILEQGALPLNIVEERFDTYLLDAK